MRSARRLLTTLDRRKQTSGTAPPPQPSPPPRVDLFGGPNFRVFSGILSDLPAVCFALIMEIFAACLKNRQREVRIGEFCDPVIQQYQLGAVGGGKPSFLILCCVLLIFN